MGIKTGAGGMNILGRDVNRSDTKLGQMSQTLAKAKSTGSGIGGLLGGIIGQILIPIPGVGAAIGAGLGSLAGSKIGGATSGVSQGDILNTKFRKESAHNITKQVAQQEFANVAKSTLSGYMQGINPGSSLSKFGKGFEAGSAGGSGFMQGMQGGFENLMGKVPTAQTGGMKADILGGDTGGFDITDITKTTEAARSKMPSLSGDVMGDATMTDKPGLLDMATQNSSPTEGEFIMSQTQDIPSPSKDSLLSRAGDWFKDNIFTGEGFQGEGGGSGQGPLQKTPESEYQRILHQGTAGNTQGQNPNADPAMMDRVTQYMQKNWAPDDTIDMNVWQMMGGR